MDDHGFQEGILVSPPFSCGVGLVMDILLRLDVRVRPPVGDFWSAEPGGFVPSEALRARYARHAPSIGERERFAFADRTSVVFEHRLDMAMLPAAPVILVVRDPVDALYSWHRRWNGDAKGLSFPGYLRNVSAFPHHMPHAALAAGPMEIYALFVLFWMLAADDLLVVRYEDLKADPVGETVRILDALGVGRSEDAIAEAARQSSFDTIRAQADSRPEWDACNRRSQTYEWRERMGDTEREAFTAAEPVAAVCRLLSYAAPAGENDVTEHASVVWTLFSGTLRTLRIRFTGGLVDPQEYLAAAAALAAPLGGRIRTTVLNDVSIDAADYDAVKAVPAAITLVRQIFQGAPPQPLERLERLVLGLSAAVANGAAGGLRHFPGSVGFAG